MSDGLRRAAGGGPVSASSVLASAGGVLGIVEGVLPTLVFLILWVTTRAVAPSVLAPLVVVVAFLVWRAVHRQTVVAAIGGAVAAAVSAVLALATHDAANAFVPGLVTNAAYAVVLAISIVVGRPLIGVVAGLLTGRRAWRADRTVRRGYTWLTVLWIALFVVRLAVELPLYLAHATDALAVARLITGVPLYAPVLVITLLAARGLARASAPPPPA